MAENRHFKVSVNVYLQLQTQRQRGFAVLLHKHPLYYYTNRRMTMTEAKFKKYDRVKVRCIETGIVYDSAAEAAFKLPCGRSAMSNHLAGRFPHIKGKHFERVEEPSDE
jgi:hypothetical protein